METYESRRPKKKVHIKQPDDFLVINVIAPAGLPWQGRKFLNTVLNQGLRYGAMDIFHFTPPEGSPWFSMANLASPGVFKLDGIGRETFTGVSFFMGLPGPDEPLEAFEKMLDVACHLGQTLGGEIRDGEHRMLTPDALSDYHQRICESMTRAEAPPRPVMA
jgi:cell division protein ZipA